MLSGVGEVMGDAGLCFVLPPRALVVVLTLPGSELLLFSRCLGNGAGALFVFFFTSHGCVVVALPPPPLRPQPRLVVVVGLSRGVGHPFSKDLP